MTDPIDDDLVLEALLGAIETDQAIIPVVFDEQGTFWKFTPETLWALGLDGLSSNGEGFLVVVPEDNAEDDDVELYHYPLAELEQSWAAISACHWSRPSTA